MNTRSLTGVVVAVVLCAFLFAAGPVFAAPPFAAARVVQSYNFENPNPLDANLKVAPILLSPPEAQTTSYWGPSAFPTPAHSSSLQSLWCAGTPYLGAVVTPPKYSEATRGSATLEMPALVDYYSAKVSFWYLMPSLGDFDAQSFALAYGKAKADGTLDFGSQVGNDGGNLDAIPLAPVWTLREYPLSTPTTYVSRAAGVFVINFIDRVEPDGGITTGQGPAIDDLAVTGFNYGPVRSLSAAPAGSKKVHLTWARPYRSAGVTTVEERSITYRVWRSPRGQDSWIELTTDSNRLANSATSFDDTSNLTDGTDYDYAVQAWDAGTGPGYGEIAPYAHATTQGAPAPGSIVGTVTASGNPLSGVSVSVNGASTASGADGSFSIPNLPAGSYTVTFAKTGYAAQQVGVSVYSGAASQVPVSLVLTLATVTPLPGANRYDTAKKIAEASMPSLVGHTDAIVACGEDKAMADPLSAAGLAGAWDAPILLTSANSLPSETLTVLNNMRDANGGTLNIHVIGGTAVVTPTLYNTLSALKGTGTIERISGHDRYGTSYEIGKRVPVELTKAGKPFNGAIVVNVENAAAFYDALAVSPIAAHHGMAMVGARTSVIRTEVTNLLGSADFVGKPRYAANSYYLSAAVRSSAGCSANMATSNNRITAATQIASFGLDPINNFTTCANVGLANKLPDALAGGAAVGLLPGGGVLLYTDLKPLAPATSSFVTSKKPDITAGWVFGGGAVVDPTTVTTFQNLLK